MANINADLSYPDNYDQTWAPSCMVNNDSQYLLHGQPDVALVTDCEFLAPMITPIIAGQVHVVNCDENYVKAIYDTPRFYATLPQKHTKCGPGRDCGDVVSTANGPEYFQLTTEDHSTPIYKEDCGKGGCGAHPLADQMTSMDKIMEAQFSNFQQIIDIRFLKYVYAPLAANLAVAEVTAAPMITITTPTGAKDVVDYAALRNDFETSLTTVLADANLAMGYDDAIQPITIDETTLGENCVCCLDGAGLQRAIGYVQGLVNDAFKTNPSATGMLIVANPKDIPHTALFEMRRDLYLGTTLAAPFVEAGLKPDATVSEHDAYNILGNTLVLSHMAPVGKVLFLPAAVRESIQFGQSPFETQVNNASNCDWEKFHLAKKTFGWMIPSCFRDKYFIMDLPDECCKGAGCPTP